MGISSSTERGRFKRTVGEDSHALQRHFYARLSCRLVAYEGLSFGMEKMCIIVSSEELFVFGTRTDQLIVRAKVSNVNRCEAEETTGTNRSRDGQSRIFLTEGNKTKAYIQLTVLDETKGWRRKQILCESLKTAKKVLFRSAFSFPT